MNADEFRKQKISNTRLAWQVYGHRFTGSFKEFKNEELSDIYHVDEDGEVRTKIIEALKARGFGPEDLAILL